MGQTKSFKSEAAMNGTFGYMYIDGVEVAELEAISAKDTINYEDIHQPGHLRAGRKMMSVEGSGEFTITRIKHDYHRQWAASVDAGQQPSVSITSVIADPNAEESVTIQYLDCTIEEIPYITAEANTIMKDTFPFHFMDRKFLN